MNRINWNRINWDAVLFLTLVLFSLGMTALSGIGLVTVVRYFLR